MKIAIRAGHSLDVRGASRIIDEVAENRKITPKVIEYLKFDGNDVLDVTPTNSGTSAQDLSIPVNKANTWGADYFVSIHLNAGGGVGSEVLYKSSKGKVYADRIVTKLASLGFTNRGSKVDTRGLYEFNYVVAPNNIVEVCFVDSQSDVNLYNSIGIDKIAKAIAEGIVGHSINKPSQPDTQPQPPSNTIFINGKQVYPVPDNLKASEERYLAENPDVADAVSKGLYGLKSGYQHWMSVGKGEGRFFDENPQPIQPPPTPQPTPIPTETKTPIISPANSCIEQMQSWAKSKNANQLLIDLASTYYNICTKLGVNPEGVYCQSAKETGYMNFGGVLDASFCNPCGLKNSSGGDNYDPNAHKRFTSWEEGITAMVDHLSLYAGANGYPKINTPDPRHFGFLLGTAKTFYDLSGKWAPSSTYGKEIENMISELLKIDYIKKSYIVEIKISNSSDVQKCVDMATQNKWESQVKEV